MTDVLQRKLRAASGRAADLHEALQMLVPVVETVDGCEGVTALQDPSDLQSFLVFERWASKAARDAGAAKIPKQLAASVDRALGQTPDESWLDPF